MQSLSAIVKQIVSPVGVGQIMCTVLVALLPGLLAHTYFFGPGIVINIVLCCVASVLIETVCIKLRKRSVYTALTDGTAIVTAFLLALTLPPLAPWWICVLGMLVALLPGKHLYGGTGHNPFNPAMLGYAFLLICFPLEMTQWLNPANIPETQQLLPGLIDSIRITLGSSHLDTAHWDAITMATPLDKIKHAAPENLISTVQGSQGFIGAYAWEWSNLGFLLGGLWMLWRRVISWHIPVSVLMVLALCYAVSNIPLAGSAVPVTPLFGLFSGAAMLGAFFIATDPVSAAASRRGQLIYGAGIGFLIFIIREFGGYPEGVAFAVLLMNLTVPTIDHYCKVKAKSRDKHEPG